MARGPKWLDEEDAIITEEMARGRGWVQRAAERLPQRTAKAIAAHATNVGMTLRDIAPKPVVEQRAPIAVAPPAPSAAFERARSRGDLIPSFLADDFARWGVR